jgi:hypothetical protein
MHEQAGKQAKVRCIQAVILTHQAKELDIPGKLHLK